MQRDNALGARQRVDVWVIERNFLNAHASTLFWFYGTLGDNNKKNSHAASSAAWLSINSKVMTISFSLFFEKVY